jgi:succinate-semialdehyde dehydrogenase / glutarate-semialdehyde dehydrogenase
MYFPYGTISPAWENCLAQHQSSKNLTVQVLFQFCTQRIRGIRRYILAASEGTLERYRVGKSGKGTAHDYSGRITADLKGLAAMVTTAGSDHDWMEISMPATGSVLGRVPACGEADVRAAIEQARAAQESWARMPFAERRAIFSRYHDLILEHKDQLADLLQLESGKARLHALEEVFDIANVTRYYAYHGEKIICPKRRQPALPFMQTWEYRRPLGVVSVIVPWNYPLTLAATDAIPALIAGNTVVVKPAKETPFAALYAMKLLRQAGIPPGVYQIVTGKGSRIGTPMIEGSNFLMFTGSTETGRLVAKQASERLIGFSAELGGKNPIIVLEDANLEAAVHGVVQGSYANTGQLCIAFERIYIQKGIYDKFVQHLVEETYNLRLGFSLDLENDVGSLINQDQLERVSDHVDDAVSKGARILAGGRPRPDLGPYFYEPTILEGVTPDMKIYSEETFGPVISLYPFNSVEDAVEAANASSYGLNAAVWTRDLVKGRRVASRIQCGTVSVNDAYLITWGSMDAPMGGMKDSGVGRRHGREGILKYTQAQNVAVQRGIPVVVIEKTSPALFVLGLVVYLVLRNRIPFFR